MMRRDVFISSAAARRLHPEPRRLHVARSSRHRYREHAQSVGDGSHPDERHRRGLLTLAKRDQTDAWENDGRLVPARQTVPFVRCGPTL